jgi:RNA polymerase sigma-70 factor (ECF subfamily)
VSGAIALSPEESGPILAAAAAAIRSETVSPRDDEEQRLISRCIAGEVEAFRPLVQRYQRVAFSVAFRMLGSRADAEDVAQQAFVDAFNALDRFRGEGREHAFSTWLLRIAVNRSKDILKSKKRTEEPLEHDIQGGEAAFAYDPSNPEANVASGERRERLESALLRVPPKYREVLILKDVEELSYEEIRAILQMPITTLKIRVVRARAMLRDLIERDGVTA